MDVRAAAGREFVYRSGGPGRNCGIKISVLPRQHVPAYRDERQRDSERGGRNHDGDALAIGIWSIAGSDQ